MPTISMVQPKMEVKLLRTSHGKVIFLESGPDFVELMFSLMNAPLGSLLYSFAPKAKDLHPLVGLKESICRLGSTSFLPGKSAPIAVPKLKTMEQLMKGTATPQPQPAVPPVVLPVHCGGCNCTRHPNTAGNCPSCGRYIYAVQQQDQPAQPNLKDNCKFMVTDSLEVLESSTITMLELMKEHVNDLKSIKTSTEKVTEESVKKLILCSIMGAKDVLTQVFPPVASETESSSVSDGSFEPVDQPES